MASFMKKIISFFVRQYWNLFSTHKWYILYREGDGDAWKRLNHKGNVSRADPFIVSSHGVDYVFYEEFNIHERHGYIGVGQIDRKNASLINNKILLKENYHLSFPFIFQFDGNYYLIPESSSNNTIDLYKFITFPYKLEKVKTLLSNINAVDSILYHSNNVWWLITSVSDNDGVERSTTSLYSAVNFLSDKFIPHQKNPFPLGSRFARGAGSILERNGKSYRVSQDCSSRYGFKVDFSEIVELNNLEYSVQAEFSIYPPKGYIAFHTYNEANGVAVADGKVIVMSPSVLMINMYKAIKYKITS